MRPTDEIWLEIVKEQLSAGDSAVIAVSKANVVTNGYIQRFMGPGPVAMKDAGDWVHEQLKKEYDKEDLTIERYESGVSNVKPKS